MKTKGFTLIEVLIAMIILSVALLAIIGMFITGVDGVSFGDRITSAVTLAQEKMEELVGLDYSEPTFWDGGPEKIGTITRIWQVKRDDPFPGMATIRVTVSWRDKSNKPRNIALVTMKAIRP